MASLLSEYISKNPRKASAELNALFGYLEKYEKGLSSIEHMYLLSTDTKSGKLCARAVFSYLESVVGIGKVDYRVITGFGGWDFSIAVENLREEVKSIIKGKKNVLLNLTGGFKPEVAVLSVIAAESGLKAYYIHEASKNIVDTNPCYTSFLSRTTT